MVNSGFLELFCGKQLLAVNEDHIKILIIVALNVKRLHSGGSAEEI